MVIEVKKDIMINGEQLFKIIVDGKVIYSNLTYEELCNVTIGDLDKVDMQDSLIFINKL